MKNNSNNIYAQFKLAGYQKLYINVATTGGATPAIKAGMSSKEESIGQSFRIGVSNQ